MGKKKLFAQFVKCLRDAVLETVKQYHESFPNGELSPFLMKNFRAKFAIDRISEYAKMRCVSAIVCNIFTGVEVVYQRTFGPVCTDCHSLFSTSLSLLSVLRSMSSHVSSLLTMVP